MEPILRAVREDGDVLDAFYELNDPEIVAQMKENLHRWILILSNTGADDATNKEVRAALHQLGAAVFDRMLKDTEIGHNKTQVFRNKARKAKNVTTGSTNITYSGITCQSNNVISIESDELAELYADYWQRLKDDNSEQSEAFRMANAKLAKEIVMPDGKTKIQLCVAPNTKLRTKPTTGAPTPVDMGLVFDLMTNAKKSIHYLAFFPGFPSIISKIQELVGTRPDLLIRGAVSSAEAMPRDKIPQRPGELPVIVCASGIEVDFADWHKELLKLPERPCGDPR